MNNLMIDRPIGWSRISLDESEQSEANYINSNLAPLSEDFFKDFVERYKSSLKEELGLSDARTEHALAILKDRCTIAFVKGYLWGRKDQEVDRDTSQ